MTKLVTDDVAEGLVSLAAECARDPFRFVLAAFPWGEPGELAQDTGPRAWQRETLEEIGTRLRAGYAPGAALMPVLKAVATGHGVGKSALLSWVALWALTTCPDTKVVLTANTEQQVRTKTWPEIARWARLSLFRPWFTVQGTSIHSTDPNHVRTWRCDAVTWSEHNLEAFAGLHNKGSRIVLLFDEASGISDRVWDVAEGALTDADTEILWLAAGNPTQPTGRFFECFHRQRDRWFGRQIDARTVAGTNGALFDEWVAVYGEDSDFIRVRVRGQFPSAGSMQFIPRDLVDEARRRTLYPDPSLPLVMGVDVARFGDDRSVISFRRGSDARSIPAIVLRGADTMTLAGRVVHEAQKHKPEAVFVDGGGVGGGVVDRLRQLGVSLTEIQFGGAPGEMSVAGGERHAYANKRAEMWGHMRAWLEGGCIPDDDDLATDLTGPQYGFAIRQGRDVILLERKSDMKLRGLRSSDLGDALALTFAAPVFARWRWRPEKMYVSEYDPFAELNRPAGENYRPFGDWRG